MDDYTLDTVYEAGDVLVVRLTPPGGGEMQSTRIAFLPGPYIVIHGDLCPGGNGLISNVGYGAAWFARGGKRLTPSYMAEKFAVPDVFNPQLATSYLRRGAEEEEDRDLASRLDALADDAGDVDMSDPREISAFIERVESESGTPDHAEAFFGPDPVIMGLLVPIQAAFARLYVAREVIRTLSPLAGSHPD